MEERRQALQDYYEKMAPEERRSRIILKPEFRDAYNEIVQAHRQFPVPEYLWKKWLPVIGPLPVVLYLQLRRYCFYNPGTGEKRDTCWPKQSRLAEEVGVKDRKTLRKALVVLEQHGFIERERVYHKDPRSGRPHQGADKYRVFFELPLRPEDAAELLMRRTATGEEKEFRAYGGMFSPHSSDSTGESSYEGKSSPHRGGEKTSSRNVTRTITSNVENVRKHEGRKRPDRVAVEALALEIGECLSTWAGEKLRAGHPSEGFHRLVVSRMPERLVREALMATRDAVERSRGGKGGFARGPAAYFAGVVKNLAAANQIDLGLRRRDEAQPGRVVKSPGSAPARRSNTAGTQSMDGTRLSAEESKAALRTLVETLVVKRP